MNGAIDRAWNKLIGWWNGFWEMLPNLAVALLVMLAFWGISRLVRSGLTRLLRRTKISRTAVPALARTGSFAVSLGGLIIALNVLHLDEAAGSLLAGAGVLGLAIGLAFQDLAANYFAGVLLALRSEFDVGDVIETHDVMGKVLTVELRTTVLETFDGQRITLPNRKVFDAALTNYSTFGKRRIGVAVGVSYDDDLEQVERVTRDAVTAVDGRREDDPVDVFFTGFGGSSIDLVARFWIDYAHQRDFFEAQHRLIKSIKRAYDDAGISIPFPIRTLDLGFDPKVLHAPSGEPGADD